MTELIRRLAEAGETIPGFPGDFSALTNLTAEELAEELRYYETTLLEMQREIFLDMATAHEAYLDGGMEAIERLYEQDSHGFARQTVEAWRMIDEGTATGNTDLIAAGNAILLRREQEHVIKDDYDEMRDRPVTGDVMTYLMTLSGAASIPGARTFAEVFPVEIADDIGAGTPRSVFGVPLPNVSCEAGVSLDTPLPAVNVSTFESRWALIEQDTLPTYVDMARNHPDQVADIVSTPVAERPSMPTPDVRSASDESSCRPRSRCSPCTRRHRPHRDLVQRVVQH
jgi:hypothetical protein